MRIDAIVVSTQHDESVKYKTLREAIVELVIEQGHARRSSIDKNTKFHVNPTGRFVVGGPQGDCGLTGRKIIVDTYGGMGRHGGGAFSGKDPSKVDRSACYYARFIAKNVVAAGLAKRCEVQVAYAIGVAKPVGVYVNTFGTGKVSDEKLEKYVVEKFDMRPKALIDELGLLAPQYHPTSAYGHFGRRRVLLGEDQRAPPVMAADLLGGKVKGTEIVRKASANGSTNGNGNGNGHQRQRRARVGQEGREVVEEDEQEGRQEGQALLRPSVTLARRARLEIAASLP